MVAREFFFNNEYIEKHFSFNSAFKPEQDAIFSRSPDAGPSDDTDRHAGTQSIVVNMH